MDISKIQCVENIKRESFSVNLKMGPVSMENFFIFVQ